MIQSFSYLVEIGDRDFEKLSSDIKEMATKITRVHTGLRGLKLEQEGSKMRVVLRIAGLTRWHVQHEAPRILTAFLRKFSIPLSAAAFEQLLTEHGRGYQRYGEGRTEMTRRPRAERMADGRPWDHIAWESDD